MRRSDWALLTAIPLSIVLLVIAWHAYLHLRPGESFRLITGRDLPAGVAATAYAHQINDNLLHTGHYWLLSGPPNRLRAVVEGAGFVRSDEETSWAIPDMEDLFGVALSRADFVEGYLSGQPPHDDLFVLFAGERTALYEHN